MSAARVAYLPADLSGDETRALRELEDAGQRRVESSVRTILRELGAGKSEDEAFGSHGLDLLLLAQWLRMNR